MRVAGSPHPSYRLWYLCLPFTPGTIALLFHFPLVCRRFLCVRVSCAHLSSSVFVSLNAITSACVASTAAGSDFTTPSSHVSPLIALDFIVDWHLYSRLLVVTVVRDCILSSCMVSLFALKLIVCQLPSYASLPPLRLLSPLTLRSRLLASSCIRLISYYRHSHFLRFVRFITPTSFTCLECASVRRFLFRLSLCSWWCIAFLLLPPSFV